MSHKNLTTKSEIQRQNSAKELINFKWKLTSVDLPLETENELHKYITDLEELQYGRSLGDLEQITECSIWRRREAMQQNWKSFEKLIRAANAFVLSLVDTHYINTLGELADLEQATEFNRPSPNISFLPVSFRETVHLNINDYQDDCGGPHVFGARVLWWCAAAQTPSQFGYSANFTNQLVSQPFWFHEFGNLRLQHWEETLQLLRQTVKRLLNAQPFENTVTVQRVHEPDGPIQGCRFSYNGKIASLTTLRYRILEYIWAKRNRTATFTDLIDDVWQKEVKDKTVSCEIGRIRNELEASGIGLNELEVVVKNSAVFLEEKS